MKIVRILAVSILLASFLSPVWAADTSMDSRVAELRAMSASERRAALRAMSAEERKGLWFAVKRANWEDRGRAPVEEGFYRDAARSLDGGANTTAGSKAAGAITYHDSANSTAGSRAVGTITYDDGVIDTSFGTGGDAPQKIIGNRFNTHTGVPVLASGTVSTVVGVVVPGTALTGDSAGFVLEGPQTVGGGAFAIFSTFTAGLTAATETVTFTGIGASYTGSSFFVLFGDFRESYIPAFGTGTTNGQGHHGVVGFTGGTGPNITSASDLTTLNALVRASGNVLPVELIEYGVE